jgi:hypothetical protein
VGFGISEFYFFGGWIGRFFTLILEKTIYETWDLLSDRQSAKKPTISPQEKSAKKICFSADFPSKRRNIKM